MGVRMEVVMLWSPGLLFGEVFFIIDDKGVEFKDVIHQLVWKICQNLHSVNGSIHLFSFRSILTQFNVFLYFACL